MEQFCTACQRDDVASIQALITDRKIKPDGSITIDLKKFKFPDEFLKGSIPTLAAAAAFGAFKCFLLLLNSGANIKWESGHRTISVFAVYGGNPFIIAKCVESNCKFDQAIFTSLKMRNNDLFLYLLQAIFEGKPKNSAKTGASYLHAAAAADNVQAIYFICNQLRADVNARKRNNKTPLMAAVKHGAYSAVKALLEHGQIDVNARDNCGKTALFYAAENRQTKIAQLLFSHRELNPNMTDDSNSHGTPLCIAAEKQFTDVVQALLAFPNVDPNVPGHYGNTPLMLALKTAKDDNSTLVSLLSHPRINFGAFNTDGENALHIAMSSKLPHVVAQLVGHPQFVPYYINFRNKSGQTPLMKGIDQNMVDNVRELLGVAATPQKMLDLNAGDFQGMTPVMLAAKYGKNEILDSILKLGVADLSKQDLRGFTALHLAAAANQKKAIQMLLQVPGINTLAINYQGKTAKDLKPSAFE